MIMLNTRKYLIQQYHRVSRHFHLSAISRLNDSEVNSYLNGFYNKFERSIYRPQIVKHELLRKWKSYSNDEVIASTRQLLEAINKDEKYKSCVEYTLKNCVQMNHQDFSNIFKIFKHLNYDKLVDVSKHFDDFLNSEMMKRICEFDLNCLYDTILGLTALIEPNENVKRAIGSRFSEVLMAPTINSNNVARETGEKDTIEDRVLAVDRNYSIWKTMLVMRELSDILDSEVKIATYNRIIDNLINNNQQMPLNYFINCLGLSVKNIKFVFNASTNSKSNYFNKIKPTILNNKHMFIDKMDEFVTVHYLFHILFPILSAKIIDQKERENLFQYLIHNTRLKLLDETTSTIEFFHYLNALNSSSAGIKQRKSVKLINKVREQHRYRKYQLDFTAESTSLNEFKFQPDDYILSKYYDKELVKKIINKFDECKGTTDLFLYNEIYSVYPTIMKLHPDTKKATQLIYDVLFNVSKDRTEFNIIKYLNLITNIKSKDNEIRLCDKLMDYIPEKFDKLETRYKVKLLIYLMMNSETLDKYLDFVLERIKGMVECDNGIRHSLEFLISFNHYLPNIFDKNIDKISQLYKTFYKRWIQICIDGRLLTCDYKHFNDYKNVISIMLIILEYLKTNLFKNELESTFQSDLLEMSNLISFDNLVRINESEINNADTLYRYITNIDLLNEILFLSENMNEDFMNKIIKLAIVCLKLTLERSKKWNDEMMFKTCIARCLCVLNIFKVFDVTKLSYFINNKNELESLLSKYYQTFLKNESVNTNKLQLLFDYVLTLVSLNCEDMDAYKDFIGNLDSFKYFDIYKFHKIQQSLALRHPQIRFAYINPIYIKRNFDKEISNDIYSSLYGLVGDNIKVDVTYPYGLSAEFELLINKNDYFYNPKLKKSIINIPVYLLQSKMCLAKTFSPKRSVALEIENLRVLGYPVLAIHLDEYNEKGTDIAKVKFLHDKIIQTLEDFNKIQQNM